VAALTARQRGDGRYLVCDVGGSGVRAGVFEVSDGNVEIVATHTADGGGWRDFDAAIRSGIDARLPGTWYEQAVGQDRRASMVLEDAVASPEEFGDTRAYRISGPSGDIDITAGQVIDGFAPTLRRLRTAIEAVTGAGCPEGTVSHSVVTGGLSWLPLTARAIADSAGAAPLVAGLDVAARGALLFARGDARLAPPAQCQAVTLPTHQIRDGLLEEVSVTLPWTTPFAALPGGALTIDRDELELTVAGQPRIARLRGLVPGPHRVGVRPTWPGSGVLVVRPVGGGSAHVVPLASLTPR
jgi:molecular chaperone DnaK (HSP70)